MVFTSFLNNRSTSKCLARADRLELSSSAWKAGVLPLNYARTSGCHVACPNYHLQQATDHPVITSNDDKNGTSQLVKERH
jgi:hypothetical protein